MAEQIQRNIVVKITADGSSLRKGLRAGSAALRGFGNSLKGLRLGLVGITGGVATLAGAAGLVALGNSARNSIDDLAKMATSLSTTVGQVQQLKFAGELSGLSLQEMTKSVFNLSKVIGKQLLSPTKEVGDALAQLGVSAKDFEGDDPVKVFKSLLPKIKSIKDPLKQAGILSTLFGASWKKLLPLVQNSKSVFARAKFLFDTLGLAIGKKASKQVEILNDNITDLVTQGGALLLKTFAALAPTINMVVVALGDLVTSYLVQSGGAKNFVLLVTRSIFDAIKTFVGFVRSVIQNVVLLAEIFSLISKLVGHILIKAFEPFAPLIDSVKGSISDFIGEILNAANPIENFASAITVGVAKALLFLTETLPGVVTKVRNAIKPFEILIDIIGKVLKFLGTAGAGIFTAGKFAAEGNFSAAGNVLNNLGNDLVGQLTGEKAEEELSEQTKLLRRIVEEKLLAAAG